jgi:hypothetical protein
VATDFAMLGIKGLTPRLTGAGARSAEGTNTGQENGEAMASVGVRVEPTVRLRRVVEGEIRAIRHGFGIFHLSSHDSLGLSLRIGVK